LELFPAIPTSILAAPATAMGGLWVSLFSHQGNRSSLDRLNGYLGIANIKDQQINKQSMLNNENHLGILERLRT